MKQSRLRRLNISKPLWDRFLDDVLYPILAFFALVMLLTSQSKAADWEAYIAPEAEHMSHATQHHPFTSHPTEYGANLLGLAFGFQFKQFNVEMVESYNFSSAWQTQYGDNANGEICGPREQFSLRIRYRFVIIAK